MTEVKQVTGTGILLFLDDVDTDRIIPARYLRCVTFDGLGEHAFEDDRRQDSSHPFDDDRFQGASILIAGRNFGCGSSREHAPQSLIRWGIRAVLAESFAEIFFGNCTSLGVPAVCASRSDLENLTSLVNSEPDLSITVDLSAEEVRAGDHTLAITIDESAKTALVSGEWTSCRSYLNARTRSKRPRRGFPT